MKFIIVAPHYTDKSSGVAILHELCDSLNKIGHLASIIFIRNTKDSTDLTNSNDASFYGPNLQWHQLNNDTECHEFIRDGIIIYPEIISGNPLGGKRVVRYLLNREGFIGKNKIEASENDFILSFSKIFHDNPHAYLMKPPFNPVFNTEDSVAALDRTLDLTYVGKGRSYNDCFVVPNTLEVTRQWPSKKPELALLFKNCRFFYTWDTISQTNIDALFCGAIPVILSASPLDSLNDLNLSELGTHPVATLIIQDGDPFVHIPDGFLSTLIEFKQNYMNLVDTYHARMLIVIDQILQHFSKCKLLTCEPLAEIKKIPKRGSVASKSKRGAPRVKITKSVLSTN